MPEKEYVVSVSGTFYLTVKAHDAQSAEALAFTQVQNVLGNLDGLRIPDPEDGGLEVTGISEA